MVKGLKCGVSKLTKINPDIARWLEQIDLISTGRKHQARALYAVRKPGVVYDPPRIQSLAQHLGISSNPQQKLRGLKPEVSEISSD